MIRGSASHQANGNGHRNGHIRSLNALADEDKYSKRIRATTIRRCALGGLLSFLVLAVCAVHMVPEYGTKVNEWEQTIEQLLLGHQDGSELGSSFEEAELGTEVGAEAAAGGAALGIIAAMEKPEIAFDYTTAIKNQPLNIKLENSSPPKDGSYPKLRPLGDLFRDWDQNNMDNPNFFVLYC